MVKLEMEIIDCYLEQVKEKNKRSFEKGFTKGNKRGYEGGYERGYRIKRKEGYERGYRIERNEGYEEGYHVGRANIKVLQAEVKDTMLPKIEVTVEGEVS